MAERRVGRYRLTRKVVDGDFKRGLPELWQAEDLGDLYYAKLWGKGPDGSSAMQALWNREVRGLMRLQGYPGASELFVKLRDLDSDDKYFFAILDGGRRQVLADVLKNRSKYSWLLNLSEVNRRRPLWEGLLRVAEALSILHSEGTLHRSLSPTSVFVSPDGQGEFRLSGFEWSLRLSGPDGGASKVSRRAHLSAPELERPDGEHSTATDWYDFGLTAAELFGAPIKGIKKRAALRTLVDGLGHLREAERDIIGRLLDDDQEKRLVDSQEIEQLLRRIVTDLGTVTTSFGRSLVMAVQLNPDRDISRTIETASEGKARARDPIAQRDWVRNDLRGDVRVIGRATPSPHYVLRGESLEYRVRAWSVDGLTTWDVGFCDGVERVPRVNSDDQVFSLGQRKLDVQLLPQVRKNIRTVRDRSAQWDKVFPVRALRTGLPNDLRTTHDFFRVTQQLDTVLTAAQICAIDILSIDRGANDTAVVVTPAREPEREELAHFVNLATPPEQLRDWFRLGAEAIVADDDEEPKRDGYSYSFLERRTIGSDTSSTTWKFVRAEPHPNGPRYHFRSQGAAIVREGRSYLARNHGGTLSQIRRRHKAIEDLRLFEGLLRLIASPRDVARANADALPPDRAGIELDDSKLAALEQLWRTQPCFAVQGPPGTGKTTLIKAFAARLFDADPSAQILVTAHSHHTVDDVRGKLSGLFADQDFRRPIVLRLGGGDGDADSPGKVTDAVLARLRVSELARRMPPHLMDRLSAAVAQVERTADADTDVRTMQVLVQDAANLTFSTLNAGGLADLAGRGRRFDWSVIEEAGKAHGFDMATALQGSHRLLLIGDHKQLPPFNVGRFTDLLGDPLRVRKAIQAGAKFAPGLVDPSLVSDEDGREPFADRCAEWARTVKLFETLFTKSVQAGAEGAPATVLTDQHRMHPDIAELVGRIFYPGEEGGTILRTPSATRARFEGPPPFTLPADSWMPEQRVIWCDVQWERKERFAEGEVEGLFASRPEVEKVVEVLGQIRPRGDEPCELQILSPYKGQLDALRGAIGRAYSAGRLTHMFSPPFNLDQGKRMGATVDEFQGSEADVVVVSLVRNNALVPWKSVGFLKERTRMNVLLSRARHKLIIVGSWDFFASRCNAMTGEYDEHAYIGRMMEQMRLAERAGTLARIPATPRGSS